MSGLLLQRDMTQMRHTHQHRLTQTGCNMFVTVFKLDWQTFANFSESHCGASELDCNSLETGCFPPGNTGGKHRQWSPACPLDEQFKLFKLEFCSGEVHSILSSLLAQQCSLIFKLIISEFQHRTCIADFLFPCCRVSPLLFVFTFMQRKLEWGDLVVS